MALMDFIKKQFIDILEWTEGVDGVLGNLGVEVRGVFLWIVLYRLGEPIPLLSPTSERGTERQPTFTHHGVGIHEDPHLLELAFQVLRRSPVVRPIDGKYEKRHLLVGHDVFTLERECRGELAAIGPELAIGLRYSTHIVVDLLRGGDHHGRWRDEIALPRAIHQEHQG